MAVRKQGKSEGFDSCDRPSILTWNWIRIVDFLAHVTWKFDGRPRKTIGHLFCTISSFVQHFIAICQFKMKWQSSGNAQFGFLSRVTFKFDGWPWKTKGYLFYATSSFVHHLIAMCQFIIELQSGKAKFGSKSTIFLSRVTLIFDGWPWKTIGHLFYAASSFGHHYIAIRKRLIWVLTYVALTFDLWPWPFAWISRLSLVITTENFMMMWWWEHSEKGVTNGQTNGRTDGRKKWS